MPYNALVVEAEDSCAAYFRELPGCVPRAEKVAELVEGLPAAVREHLSWLAGYGLVNVSEPVEVAVAEHVPALEGRGVLFTADRAPVTDSEIDTALRVAELARADLVRAYENIPLDRREEQPAPGEWSGAEQLRHVADSELWYVDALRDGPSGAVVDRPADPVAALEVSAAHAEAILRSLPIEARGRLFVRDGEEWTAAKVLRRMAGHLREHLPGVTAT